MALVRGHLHRSLINNYRKYPIVKSAINKHLVLSCSNPVQTVPQRCLFWERHRKGGYETAEEVSTITHIRNGFKEFKKEFKILGQEIKELWEMDPLMVSRPGETDVLWCFNDPAVLDKFIATSDSDHNEGFSRCGLDISPAGRALFHGYLDTRVPKDGKIKKAGYCAIRSKRLRKSFKRDAWYDWHLYNTLVLKVRGDGRSYLLNISCEGKYDITWNDIYHYVLFTRGGPYWQYVKIPFSKFVLGSKGRLQDRQCRMRFDRVTHFGITCGDKIVGNFNLEIEYIGLEFDPTHEEEFAYEMYKTDKYIVGV